MLVTFRLPWGVCNLNVGLAWPVPLFWDTLKGQLSCCLSLEGRAKGFSWPSLLFCLQQ